MLRYIGFCGYCGIYKNLTKDHVIPKSLIKKQNIIFKPKQGNIILACFNCNQNKGSQTLFHWLSKIDSQSSHHIYAKRFLGMDATQILNFYNLQKAIYK